MCKSLAVSCVLLLVFFHPYLQIAFEVTVASRLLNGKMGFFWGILKVSWTSKDLLFKPEIKLNNFKLLNYLLNYPFPKGRKTIVWNLQQGWRLKIKCRFSHITKESFNLILAVLRTSHCTRAYCPRLYVVFDNSQYWLLNRKVYETCSWTLKILWQIIAPVTRMIIKKHEGSCFAGCEKGHCRHSSISFHFGFYLKKKIFQQSK